MIRPERTTQEALDRAVKSMMPGTVDGRVAQAMPIRQRVLPQQIPDPDALEDALSSIGFFQDVHAVTAAGSKQLVGLSFLPIDHSEHVRWHPSGGLGIYQPASEWSRDGDTITIPAGNPLEVGDLITVEYAHRLEAGTGLLDEFYVDSTIHQLDGGLYAESKITLEAGKIYRVAIDGNWTAWSDGSIPGELSQTFTYGAGNNVPIKYHAPGRNLSHSQFNAEWFYASGDTSNVPKHDHTGVGWNLVGGTSFVHDLEPIGGIGAAWNSTNHVYEYEMTGQGHPIRFRLPDGRRYDNDGLLKISIYGSLV